mgnify:CR=1 FL=1
MDDKKSSDKLASQGARSGGAGKSSHAANTIRRSRAMG